MSESVDQFLTHYHCRVCGSPNVNEYGYCEECETIDQFDPDDYIIEGGFVLGDENTPDEDLQEFEREVDDLRSA